MLNVAVLEGDTQAIYDHIFNDGGVEEPNDVGNRPIHACAYTGNVTVCKLLVKAGAGIHHRNAKGRTALHIAARDDRGADMVRLLLDLGADAQAKDVYQKTPRDYATVKCALPLDEHLLARWDKSLELSFMGEEDEDEEDEEREGEDEEVLVLSPRLQFKPVLPARNSQAEALLAALEHKAVAAKAAPPFSPTMPPLPAATVKPAAKPTRDAISVSPVPPMPPLPLSNSPEADHSASSSAMLYVDIDGERIYIPQSTPEYAAPAVVADDKEEDEEASSSSSSPQPTTAVSPPLPPQFEDVAVTVRITDTSYESSGLGMELSTEHEVYMLVVERLDKALPAFRAGVRAGDALLRINGDNIEQMDMDEIAHRLETWFEDEDGEWLELTLLRSLPSLVLSNNDDVDWRDEAVAERTFPRLFSLLQHLPSNLTEDECFKLIHAFQECMALVRRGEAPIGLVDCIQRVMTTPGDGGDGGEKSRLMLVERAMQVVTDAVRQMDDMLGETDDDATAARAASSATAAAATSRS